VRAWTTASAIVGANPAFRRQGEWFFVPAPDLVVDPVRVLVQRTHPSRSGKPHLVQELSVWVARRCMSAASSPTV